MVHFGRLKINAANQISNFRRVWPPEQDSHQPRFVKRLFTPEIKRKLKEWLVRRRENPYPSRDEKKRLAIETGLTYTQICNWFANWRRKLKNSERERIKRSWGHLIKHYNTNARGNVEQFSISSEDSIWEEEECEHDEYELKRSDDEYESREDGMSSGTECALVPERFRFDNYSMPKISCFLKEHVCDKPNMPTSAFPFTSGHLLCCPLNINTLATPQPGSDEKQMVKKPCPTTNTAKYKHKIMEKYLRDTHGAHSVALTQSSQGSDWPLVSVKQLQKGSIVDDGGNNTALTKWLESAARFTPDKHNYFIECNGRNGKLERKPSTKQVHRITIIPANSSTLRHHSTNSCPTQLEMDAAEALANMAFNCRQRLMDCKAVGARSQTVNAISS